MQFQMHKASFLYIHHEKIRKSNDEQEVKGMKTISSFPRKKMHSFDELFREVHLLSLPFCGMLHIFTYYIIIFYSKLNEKFILI